ncbi:response regulator [Paenibacillus sp. YN15]|uniref:response regulator transcription factor n=1 Tax=Paenibacillus sp. YN15 TaxID=1742774 RepID=UPI000DCD6BFF|nr:response regulator [Paenibacillus sp. YN15]RAU96400.1 DNA-binding response regulator [Paenibacillus sp. YN15]
MLKALLVDDEQLARDSISRLVNWAGLGLEFLGAAKNGIEALELIRLHRPHIVLTDIKMPVMSGLELIRRARELCPDTVFIVLSGYGEYDYTSEAMQYGVRSYLLKPSNEEKITEVLLEAIAEVGNRERDRRFVARLQHNLEKVLPHVKEQFLRDIALTGVYNKQDCDYFMELFGITDQTFQLILFKYEKEADYIEKFALKNIAEDVFTPERVFLDTIIEDSILVLAAAMEQEEMNGLLSRINSVYKQYYRIELFVAVSDRGGFSGIRGMYKQAREILNYRFYFTEGCILTYGDVVVRDRQKTAPDIPLLTEELASHVKAGNKELAMQRLEELFAQLEGAGLERNQMKAYCMELYLALVRQGSDQDVSDYLPGVVRFQEFTHAAQALECLRQTVQDIAGRNYEATASKQVSLVERAKQIVGEQLGNPELSLQWISREVLYVNEDYLGKLFSRESGVRFSQYVLKRRMELAMELLRTRADLKVYDISRISGFPEDAQYFSKVFKKHTGMTPTEYMKAGLKELPEA